MLRQSFSLHPKPPLSRRNLVLTFSISEQTARKFWFREGNWYKPLLEHFVWKISFRFYMEAKGFEASLRVQSYKIEEIRGGWWCWMYRYMRRIDVGARVWHEFFFEQIMLTDFDSYRSGKCHSWLRGASTGWTGDVGIFLGMVAMDLHHSLVVRLLKVYVVF